MMAVLLAAALAALQAQAAVIEVSGVQTYIGGSNTSVPGSGTADNYSSGTAVNDYAVFDMQKDGLDYADLKVTYKADNGTVGSDLLVARTSDSQGLTDVGTVTVLFDIGSSGGGGITLQFDWYQPGSFVNGAYQSGSLLSDKVLFTTFDIDYNQYVGSPLGQIEYAAFHTNTALSADLDSQSGWILAKDDNANATYIDLDAAAQFMMKSGSLELVMGKQISSGPAMFMFEFRDPSTLLPDFEQDIVAIPEPTAMMLIGFVGAASLWIRRRFTS